MTPTTSMIDQPSTDLFEDQVHIPTPTPATPYDENGLPLRPLRPLSPPPMSVPTSSQTVLAGTRTEKDSSHTPEMLTESPHGVLEDPAGDVIGFDWNQLYDELMTEKNALFKEKTQLEEQLHEDQITFAIKEHELSDLQSQLLTVRSEKEKIDGDLQKAREDIQKLKCQVEDLENMNQCFREILNTKSGVKMMKEDGEGKGGDDDDDDDETCRKQLEIYQQQLDQNTLELTSLREKVAELDKTLTTNKQKLFEESQKAIEAEKKVVEMTQTMDMQSSQTERGLKEMQEVVVKTQKEIETLTEAWKKTSTTLNMTKEELENSKAKVQELEQMLGK